MADARMGTAANGAGMEAGVTAADLFAGTGEMRAAGRALDWGTTPLGAVSTWPLALRVAVRLMLEVPVATCLWVGPTYTLVYNDAYTPILGAKHPRALGRPGAEVWDELWPALEPQFAQVRAGGPAVFADDALLRMERLADGRAEDAWFTYALSALRDEGTRDQPGGCLAVYNVAVEVTERARIEHQRHRERARLEAVFAQSPSFLAVLRGPDNVFELVNGAYEQIIGRGRDVVGKPLFEAIPEARGQGFDEYLGQVRATGEALVFRDLPVLLDRVAGAPREERFIDITYLPLLEIDAAGGVTHEAVIAHGTDVTDQVLARREAARLLAESEAANSLLKEQSRELERFNQLLQEQAVELEVQAETLQATAAELEERTQESEAAGAEAEATRSRSDAVLGSIADPFILLDRDWRITQVNDAAEPPLQAGRAILLGRTLWEAFPGLQGSLFEPFYRDAMATGRPTAVEDYFAPLDTWFDVRIYPWSGGLMVHFRDVSARKAIEAERERLLGQVHAANAELQRMTAAAQASERRARFLADLGQALQPVAEPDVVMATTARLLGEHLGADRCAYAEVEADEDTFAITGNYTRDDTISIVGRFTFRAFGAEVLRLMRANAAYVVHDVEIDARVTPEDQVAYAGTQIRAVICVPLHKAGRFVAAMAVHQRRPREWTPDEVELVVTVVQRCWEALERARALRRLRENETALRAASSQLTERTAAAEDAQRAAEEANQTKTAFLSAMSHELRTPLNAIAGYAQLLALGVRGPVTEAQQLDLERLRRANQHMSGLVESVLAFARVEAGRVEYHLESVDLGLLVQDLEALVGPQLAAKGLGYDHDGCGPETPDRPHVIRADPEKVRQILINLLTNATKATEAPGRVALQCQTDSATGMIRVRVTDTGRGIPADQLERVFEPFVQLDRQRTQPSQQGVGLGLAISRELARGMGGDLTAESSLGRGSAFTLSLPRA